MSLVRCSSNVPPLCERSAGVTEMSQKVYGTLSVAVEPPRPVFPPLMTVDESAHSSE